MLLKRSRLFWKVKKKFFNYWSPLFQATPLANAFVCQDIGQESKARSQTVSTTKLTGYLQMTFEWLHIYLNRKDGSDRSWLLITEGRHLTGEQPLFLSTGMSNKRNMN